ncbi:MAG: dephospho-CoA kinase [Gallionellaceae bacterium]|jgi:dephospho-CoA kinase|nr:dephospho-CoA kinase [Gallionellaceae bacterium]
MSARIGLTGGIGSGKSTVAALFSELGVPVVDSDEISRQLTASGGAAMARIRAEFGDAYVDAAGALNRVRMRREIFSDAVAKQRLEAILHPLIRAQMQAQADAAGDAPYVLLVVPLLFENPDYRALVTRALVVDCTEQQQIDRAMARSGLSEQEVRAIMRQQISRAERLRLADDIIENRAEPEALRGQVAALHRDILKNC